MSGDRRAADERDSYRDEDPFHTARGIFYGVLIGGAIWAGILGVFVMWIRG